MRCTILTLFPGIILPVFEESILKIAQEKGLLDVEVEDLRRYTEDKHKTADDYPYGGGAGMVMKPEPIFKAIDNLREKDKDLRIIIPSPQGRIIDQQFISELSRENKRIVFICGHYEGIDERVISGLSAEEISIGDYVLTGGELPALVIIDAAARLIPGVLGNAESLNEESFSPYLDYPHYTRPSVFRGMKVPDVLLSGNHNEIRKWKLEQAMKNTIKKRPDIIERIGSGNN